MQYRELLKVNGSPVLWNAALRHVGSPKNGTEFGTALNPNKVASWNSN